MMPKVRRLRMYISCSDKTYLKNIILNILKCLGHAYPLRAENKEDVKSM